MIDDFESLEQSVALARTALHSMSERRIPACPMNYTLWYAHGSGNYPDLSKALELKLANGETFTRSTSQELFDRYFGTALESDGIRETGDRLKSTLEEVLKLVAEAGQETGSYGDKMVSVQDSLSEQPDATNVGRMVQVILSETQKIIDKSRALEGNLADSATEIAGLQDHLEQVRQESMTDALTGVANRKCFDARIAEAIAEAQQENEPLCLLLGDIDFFKKFNDTFGHKVGDEVLKLVGNHLKEGVKGRDTVARYGGEEFALILPQTDLAGAASLADSLCEKLARKELKNRRSGESFGQVTLSVGAAKYRPGEPVDELVQRADEALYQAKRNGRNRVETEIAPGEALSAAV